MKNCQNCYKSLAEKEKFCSWCGMMQFPERELLEANDPIETLTARKLCFSLSRKGKLKALGITVIFLVMTLVILIEFILVPEFYHGESSPILVMDSIKRSDGSYMISVISISAKRDLEAFQFFLRDENGRTHQDGEVGLQEIGGRWHGIDITWDGKTMQRRESNGGPYDEPAEAQVRIDEVKAGHSSRYSQLTKGEGTISVYYYDNDFDGKLTAGDIFNVKGNSYSHTADDEWSFDLKFDITGEMSGSIILG